MDDSNNITALINNINMGMDILVSIAFALALLAAFIFYTIQRINKDGSKKGIYLGVFFAIQEAFLVLVIWIFPNWMSSAITKSNVLESETESGNTNAFVIRWILLYLVIVPLVYFITRKHSGRRGLYASLFILTTFLFGWLYDRWIGIIFISIPLSLLFLHLIDRLAQVIMPASDPEDKKERWKKTQAYLFYLLGIQYPFWVVTSKVSREFDTRISGDYFNGFGKPGVVWSWPHQVVGLSAGVEFNKVDGPGTLFTEQYERPVAIVDLRTQLRTTEVDAMTKNGMLIKAILFTSFSIDKDTWPKKEWSRAEISRLKYANPLLADAFDLDHTEGSYHYSSKRVQAALCTAGVNAAPKDGELPAIQWDEWVVKQVEHATRQVISQRNLDELWRPRDDGPRASALDEMAAEIKGVMEPKLREVGVCLFAARIVNYSFGQDHPIRKQQIQTWQTYWSQKVTEAQADAEGIYRGEIEKAHTFAKSVLLDAIADSLDDARKVNADLPRHVIAQYYIHALEEYIKKQPGINDEESKKRLENIRQILFFRTEGNV